MLRRISFSSLHDMVSNGACGFSQADNLVQLDSPFSSLVYYTAIARGTAILSEYTAEGNTDLPAIAAACLEDVPPLHSRFSYTINQRRFICLLDGVATYCAIMDEALSKADAYSFLQQVRDAFSSFGKGRGMSLTLGAHFLDDAMSSIMGNLAASFVGIPQKEKDRIQAERQVECPITFDTDASCPSASVPLCDVSGQGCDSRTSKEGHLGTRTPWLPLTGTVRKGKSKMKEQGKSFRENKGGKKMDSGSDLEVLSILHLKAVVEMKQAVVETKKAISLTASGDFVSALPSRKSIEVQLSGWRQKLVEQGCVNGVGKGVIGSARRR